MVTSIFAFTGKQQLEMYLVQRGIKPAGVISISKKRDKSVNQMLQEEKVIYQKGEIIYENGENGEKREERVWYLGRDKKRLRRLVEAHETGCQYRIGIALGYPWMSAALYNQEVNGIQRNEAYFAMIRAEALVLEKDLPSWLSYISHVPYEMHFVPIDFDNVRFICDTISERMGRERQQFVRETNKSLAVRVEREFLLEPYPKSWKLKANNSIELTYAKGA